MADIVKQVIVVNLAVPMPIGRLAAQIAHAAVSSITSRGSWTQYGDIEPDYLFELHTKDAALQWWMKEQFTKVVCKAWGKPQMISIIKEAKEKGVHVAVMEEDGFITAIALGPAFIKDLEFTKGLPLL